MRSRQARATPIAIAGVALWALDETFGRGPLDHAVFPQPDALLSEAPNILGTDGTKMSKSRGNTIELRMSADETAKVLKKAVTDSDRRITFDPATRPEVSNLVQLAALTTGRDPHAIAEEIGREVDYRPVETDGASRAAALIAELL